MHPGTRTWNNDQQFKATTYLNINLLINLILKILEISNNILICNHGHIQQSEVLKLILSALVLNQEYSKTSIVSLLHAIYFCFKIISKSFYTVPI